MLVDLQRRPASSIRFLLAARRRRRAEATLPLAEAGRVALGRRSDVIHNFLVHDDESPFWSGVDRSGHLQAR
ncbi:hypothetical protein [Streptosporangium roseum]|uniref:hypothetical protein n=1 Tax=Streptosporangium roseum TaxID=2001 RepID=UPI003327B5F5